ncbi:MAG: type II toxin-antitoxin system MqsR family toxin [Sulfuricellaceae bacterium]
MYIFLFSQPSQLKSARSGGLKLQEILAIVAAQGLSVFTATAVFNAAAMGLSEAQAVAVVISITRAMFYKSMTTHNDNRKWQDVYHVSCPNGSVAYIKLTLQDGAVVIQFKEK